MTGSGAQAADGSTGSGHDAEVKAEISRLVSRALELQDGGEERWLEEACADRPDLIDEVRSAVEGASQLPGLLFGQVGVDRLLGTRLADRYEVRSRLGSGSMGVVYEAFDVELRRAVAVKLLRADLFDGLKAAERFKREAHAMAAVEHAAVIAIHDRGQTEGGESYIVMDLIDGLPLSAVVEELSGTVTDPSTVTAEIVADRLNLETHRETSYVRMVARWVAELAAGLGETHRASVVHRDIKPSNVIIRRDGRPVLVDFGIAHLTEDASITRGGTSVGTPAYMPPESLSGKQVATKEGDIYGLGALLYSLVALRPPYLGTPSEVLAALSTREPDRVERLYPGLPRDIRAIIETCMARRPSARYSSAKDLEEDLRSFLGHRPVKARPLSPLRRVARRLARSRAFQGAVVALGVVATVAGIKAWQGQIASTRESAWMETMAGFAAGTTVSHPSTRRVGSSADRLATEDLLARALDLADDPFPTLLFRAAYALDQGDVDQAAADFSEIASAHPSPFTAAVASAYEGLQEGALGHASLDLSGLPPTQSRVDLYILAYHGLRDYSAKGDKDARRGFEDEGVLSLPFGEELRWVLALPDSGVSGAERVRLAVELHEDVLEREAHLGLRTATSAHTLSVALGTQQRFVKALEFAEASVSLAPRVHTNRINAAHFAFVTGDLDKAKVHARVALELNPSGEKPATMLVWTSVVEDEFEAAHEVVRRHGASVDTRFPWWSAEMGMWIETYRALALSLPSGGEPDQDSLEAHVAEVAAALDEARHQLERADALGRTGRGARSTETIQSLQDAIGTGEASAVFQVLVRSYLESPLDWWRLDLIQTYFPHTFHPGDQEVVEQLIEQLVDESRTR